MSEKPMSAEERANRLSRMEKKNCVHGSWSCVMCRWRSGLPIEFFEYWDNAPQWELDEAIKNAIAARREGEG